MPSAIGCLSPRDDDAVTVLPGSRLACRRDVMRAVAADGSEVADAGASRDARN